MIKCWYNRIVVQSEAEPDNRNADCRRVFREESLFQVYKKQCGARADRILFRSSLCVFLITSKKVIPHHFRTINEAIQFIFKFIFGKGGSVMLRFNLRSLFLVLDVVILATQLSCNQY